MIKKVTVTKIKESNSIKSENDPSQIGKQVQLKTIQVKNHDPSNFTFHINIHGMEGLKTEIINLVDYRTKFISGHKDLYVLDVSKMEEFQFYDSHSNVDITVGSVEDFESIEIELYFNLQVPFKRLRPFLVRR
jgi:hypothetical protein